MLGRDPVRGQQNESTDSLPSLIRFLRTVTHAPKVIDIGAAWCSVAYIEMETAFRWCKRVINSHGSNPYTGYQQWKEQDVRRERLFAHVRHSLGLDSLAFRSRGYLMPLQSYFPCYFSKIFRSVDVFESMRRLFVETPHGFELLLADAGSNQGIVMEFKEHMEAGESFCAYLEANLGVDFADEHFRLRQDNAVLKHVFEQVPDFNINKMTTDGRVILDFACSKSDYITLDAILKEHLSALQRGDKRLIIDLDFDRSQFGRPTQRELLRTIAQEVDCPHALKVLIERVVGVGISVEQQYSKVA